jgi:hypothetical protein
VAPGAGNLISGNRGDGIDIYTGTGNVVEGNSIGTDVSGTLALGNGGNGVLLSGSQNTTVGGVTASARNLISANHSTGITIVTAGASGNVIEGNFIGVDASGTSALGNGGNGVAFLNGASNNRVGGTAPGAGNVLAFNGGDGVLVLGGSGDAILRNRIFANGHLGIELLNHGNNDQPAPALTSVVSGGGATTVEGTFTGQPGTTYLIELFADSGNPAEGRRFLGAVTLMTGADGVAHFTLSFGLELGAGEVVTATATDPLGNTSAFSAGMAVTG